MKKKYYILIALSLFFSSAFSQTIVTGGIFTNTTWTLANSPYLMTGNVVVFPGVTLTIEPGVEIRVKNNGNNGTRYYLETRGTINMVGQSGALITIKADTGTTTIGTWEGIRIKNSQGGNINYNYVSISNSIQVFSYDGAVPSYINLTQSEFNYNYYAINVGLELKAENCRFKGNENTISGWSLYEFKNCVFDSNSVALSIYATELKIDSCVFKNNYAAIVLNSSVFSGMQVKNSLFTNNNIAFNYPNNGEIRDCEFLSNRIAIGNANSVIIKKCLLEGNELAVAASVGTTVDSCEIINNQVGVAIGYIAFSQPTPIIQNNRICFNTDFNIDNQTDLNLFIPTNCFCETDSTLVEAKIFDGYDDVAKGLISYAIFDTTCTTVVKMVNKSPGTSSISEIEASTISIFPNPATDILNIANSTNLTQVELFNINGQMQLKAVLLPGNNAIEISKLGQGIYFARIANNVGAIKTVRITKL